MAWYPYSYKTAFDPITGEKAPAGSAGQIYAIGDTGFTTPLQPYDLAGLPVELMVQGDLGYIPTFQVEDETSVVWKSGDYIFEFTTTMPLPGPTGARIVNATDNNDGTMSFELSDGSTVGPIEIPEGPEGPRGPAGYNATGAVEDQQTLADYVNETAGSNPFSEALTETISNSVDDVYAMFDDYHAVSGPHVTGSGDSLTNGVGGDGTTWPAALQTTLLNAYSNPGNVTNLGVGGEDSATIAGRTGLGVPWLATVEGGTIPATGGVTVTLVSSEGAPVAPLQQGERGVNPVIIAGVKGDLSYTNGVYTFTRTVTGDAVAASNPEVVSTEAGRTRQSDIFIMWWGQNDGTADATDIIRRQNATIRRLRAFRKRWLVLGLSSGDESTRAAMDAQFADAHGDRFLNIREYLSTTAALDKEGITPTQDDLDAIAVGAVPPSFLFDTVHLNAAGYRRVGRAIYDRLKALGWNDQWGTLGDDSDVPVPQIIFADDFERVSADLRGETTPIGGKTWSIYSGGNAVPYIDAGAGAVALNGDAEGVPFINGGSTDGVFRAALKTEASRTALVFRIASAGDMLSLHTTAAGTWGLHERAGFSFTLIQDTGVQVAAGDDITVTLTGATGTININGVEAYNGAMPETAGTGYGFFAYSGGVNQRWELLELSE